MKAMLLAAGRGERMGSLTQSTPKPLLEVAGRTLIDRQLSRLHAAGIRDVVINLSYGAEPIRRHVLAIAPEGLHIEFIDEGTPPLETAGGIINALRLLGDAPFLVVNADVVCGYDLASASSSETCRLVLVANPPHHTQGDYGIDSAGYATFGPPQFTFSGISVLSAGLFRDFAPGRRRLRPVLDAAVAKRLLLAELYSGPWLDVGTPERLAEAQAMIEKGGIA